MTDHSANQLSDQSRHALIESARRLMAQSLIVLAGGIGVNAMTGTAQAHVAEHSDAAIPKLNAPAPTNMTKDQAEQATLSLLHGSVTRTAGAMHADSSVTPSPLLAGANNAKLPKLAERIMNRDTLYLPELGCTGSAIRNDKGALIGAVTAEHCSLLDNEAPRVTGSDGKTYIVQKTPVIGETGESLDDMKKVAEFDRFILPNSGDMTHDLVLAIKKGEAPEAVLRAYRKTALSVNAMKKFAFGKVLYDAGWPVYQPKNYGPEEVQRFALKFLGLGETTSSTGQKLAVAWMAAPPTKDGAETSFGISGSKAFALSGNQSKSIGTASAFYDLTDSVPGYPGVSQTPTTPAPTSKHSIASVIGFSYEIGYPAKGTATVVHSVRSMEQIPGQESPQQAIAAAKAEFENPNIAKTFVNGVMFIGPDQTVPGSVAQWITNPLLFHDSAHKNTVIAWADSSQPDDFGRVCIDDSHLARVVINSSPPPVEVVAAKTAHARSHEVAAGTTPNFMNTTGAITYQPSTSKDGGDFTDQAGNVLGMETPGEPGIGSAAYELVVANGQLQLVPTEVK